jgi:hypothetical protein
MRRQETAEFRNADRVDFHIDPNFLPQINVLSLFMRCIARRFWSHFAFTVNLRASLINPAFNDRRRSPPMAHEPNRGPGMGAGNSCWSGLVDARLASRASPWRAASFCPEPEQGIVSCTPFSPRTSSATTINAPLPLGVRRYAAKLLVKVTKDELGIFGIFSQIVRCPDRPL